MKKTKKIISLLLALVMLLGMLPMAAAAERADLTMETGHAAMYTPDRYLSKIVLKGVGGTASGSGYDWDVVVPADTDTTEALTFELTASTSAATSTISYFWAVGSESIVSANNVATSNTATLSVVPEWDAYGHASVVVGLGTTSKLVTKYNISISLEGAAENLNEIKIGETNARKYFLHELSVTGATVTERTVSDTDFSGSSSGHKATIDITLDAMPEDSLTLDMRFGDTGSSYMAVNGGSREKFDGTYSYAADLSKSMSYTFVTYSTSTNSTVRGTYTVNFTVLGGANLPPILSGAAEEQAEVWIGEPYALDLSRIFTDPEREALTYTVSVNGADAAAADENYTFLTEVPGDYTLVFRADDGTDVSEENYTVLLTVHKNEAPVILDGAITADEAVRFATWTLDLSEIFTDPDGDSLTYSAKVADGSYMAVSGSTYSYVPTEVGMTAVTFKADDGHADSEEHTVTLTVTASEVSHVVSVGQTVANGSFDFIRVTDVNGSNIDGISMAKDGTTVTVTLPRTIGANGKVRAWFHLTQNGLDGTTALPFVSTKTGTSGTTSGQAQYNIVSYRDTTLTSGKGTSTVYFYNKIPSMRDNVYTTYTIRYALENRAPALIGAASKADRVVAGEAYAVALSEIFTDADGDTLTYTVSVNGGTAETVGADYSYLPTVATTDVLVFTATDGMDVSETYTLTLEVANSSVTYDVTVYVPEGLSPVFYATVGYDENGVDTFTETAPLDHEADGTVYTVKVPVTVSVISFRDDVWGGMSAAVSEGSTLYLEDFIGYLDHIHGGKYVTADQAIFMVKDNEGHYAVSGSSATDEELDGVTYYRFLLAATGNDGTYTLIAKGCGELADIYGETIQNLFALEPNGQDFAALSLTVSNPITITVPEGAEAGLYRQINNYNTVRVDSVLQSTKDGLTTYTFKNPGGNLSWRAWQENKITKAGFLGYNEDTVTVTWDDTDATPDTQVSYNTDTAMGMRHDATAVVNVNAQNHLVLGEGGSFRLRGFRWWQIINNDVSNIMIEPDFHYTVTTGSDVVSINRSSGGNTTGNRMDLTAIGTGMAVVEVGFDAIKVSGMTYEDSSEFIYGACDPDRTALVVVSAGEKTVDADFGIVGAGGENAWDAEFDTVYFLGEQGSLTLTPAVSGTLYVSHDKGVSWKKVTADNGTYTAPIASGNNILKLETADGVDYQVVRGKKLTVAVSNLTDGKQADAPIAAGDTVQIEFVGMHHAMSKMSAVYNPNYGGASSMNFAVERSGAAVASAAAKAGQYQILRTMTYTVPTDAADGEVITLRGVSITYSNMGSGAGRHRDITDTGLGTNTSATNSNGKNCTLPTMLLTVGSAGITWEEPAEPAEKITIAGSNMTLGNELEVNFMVKKTDLTESGCSAVITQVLADGSTRVTKLAQENWNTMGIYHKISARIAAKEMADSLAIEIFDADGNVISKPYASSVRDYAGRALAATTTTDYVRIMVVDMLNYGAAAQKHFKYNVQDLANNALTEEQQALATAKVTCTNKQVKDNTIYGSNLSLEDSILLNTFFKGLKGKDLSTMYAMVTFTGYDGIAHEINVPGTELQPYGSSGDIYKVVVDDVVLADAKQLVTVTVYNADGSVHGSGSDSVESYVARAEQNNADTYGLYANIMKFAASAYAYFTNR